MIQKRVDLLITGNWLSTRQQHHILQKATRGEFQGGFCIGVVPFPNYLDIFPHSIFGTLHERQLYPGWSDCLALGAPCSLQMQQGSKSTWKERIIPSFSLQKITRKSRMIAWITACCSSDVFWCVLKLSEKKGGKSPPLTDMSLSSSSKSGFPFPACTQMVSQPMTCCVAFFHCCIGT